MSKVDEMFRPFEPDELLVRAEGEAEQGLAGIEILESDPEEPNPFALEIASVLPYGIHVSAYRVHVDRCGRCADSRVYDTECEHGNALAQQAADACVRQSAWGRLN